MIVCYTDGSGTRAHLPCGAGVVIYDEDPAPYYTAEPIVEASRPLGCGSNNHAELSAVRIALWLTDQWPLKGRPLVIRSDSEYAITMCSRRGALDPERPNARLVNIIRRAMLGRDVHIEYVPGHAGVPGNVRADKLAGLARLRCKAALAELQNAGASPERG